MESESSGGCENHFNSYAAIILFIFYLVLLAFVVYILGLSRRTKGEVILGGPEVILLIIVILVFVGAYCNSYLTQVRLLANLQVALRLRVSGASSFQTSTWIDDFPSLLFIVMMLSTWKIWYALVHTKPR